MNKCLHLLSLLTVLGFAGQLILPSKAIAAPPASAFGELPIAFDADLSPDGKRLAIILNSDGQYYVATRDMNSSDRALGATSLGQDTSPSFVKWVNNDRYFVSMYKMEEYGGVPFSAGHIYTRDINDKKGRLLLRPKFFRQYNNTIVNWLENDPDYVLMSLINPDAVRGGPSNIKRRDGENWPGVFKVNVKNGKDKRVQAGRENIRRWYTDPNGNPVIGVGLLESGKFKMIVKDRQTDRWTSDESYPGLEADTPIFSILKDGKEIIIGDYNGQDTMGLYVYSLEKRARVRALFHNDEYDVSGVIVSTDGETVIGARYVAEQEETELLGKYGTLVEEMRAKYPEFSIDYVDQTEDGNTILFMLTGPYEPGGLFKYSVGDAEPTMIERRYSKLSAQDMGNVFTVKYKARDGQRIPAFVTLPPTVQTQADIKNLPFIVLPHGGPYGRDEKRFDYFAQFFATRGYGVMQMNFRGSAGYGKSFENAGRDNWLVMQEDVEDATRYLLEKGYSDPNRTCIAGWSYGGYAALMGAAKDNEGLYDCVISMAGLTDIDEAKKDLKDYVGGRAAAKTFFGEAMKDRDMREANSPVNVADQITVPVFLAHGDQDQNVRYNQFTRMRRALEKAGGRATYMTFKDEDHFLSKQKNREAFFVGVEKFLVEVNGPSEHMAK